MNRKIGIILTPFLLVACPVAALFSSILTVRSRFGQLLFAVAFAIFGYSFAFLDPAYDSFRHAYSFVDGTYDYGIVQIFIDFWNGLLPDFYFYALSAIIRPITIDPKVLFCVLGFIYGFALGETLRLFLRIGPKKIGVWSLALVICFVFASLPVTTFNGGRFGLAILVFFYCSMRYLEDGRKRWWWGLASTLLIHFSFAFFLAVLGIFLLVKRWPGILWIAFLASIPISILISAFDIQKHFIGVFGNGTLGSRFNTYSNTEYIENQRERLESFALHIRIMRDGYIYVLMLLMFFIKSRYRELRSFLPDSFFNSWLWIVYFFTITNLFAFIPELEKRSTWYLGMIICCFVYKLHCTCEEHQQQSNMKLIILFMFVASIGRIYIEYALSGVLAPTWRGGASLFDLLSEPSYLL